MKRDYKHFHNSLIDEIDSEIEHNYFSHIWEEVINLVEFYDLLDVGCGNGVFSANLKHKLGCRLIGVDGSEYALEQARNNGFDETFVIKDFCEDKLPFENNLFNMIVCKDVLEHLINPEYLIKEIYRVCKPNGYILVHVPNHFTLKGRIKFLFDNNIDPYNWFPNAKRWNHPHIRFFTYESFSELLVENNFSLIKNLSSNFHSLPYFPGRIKKIIPFRSKIEYYLSNRFPTQFAQGFTLLMQKTKK